jgi:hypothetical protein
MVTAIITIATFTTTIHPPSPPSSPSTRDPPPQPIVNHLHNDIADGTDGNSVDKAVYFGEAKDKL